MRRTKISLLAPVAMLVLGWQLTAPVSFGDQQARAVDTEQQAVTDRQTSVRSEPEAGENAGAEVVEPDAPAPVRRSGTVQATAPPRHLKKVGDHWTAWDPPDPESFPSDARLHIIVRGDTLWDLADLTFGDPYLWPQIWNENRYILDSHWIYPGDPLLIPARPIVITPVGSASATPEILPQGQQGAPHAAFPPRPGSGTEDETRPVQQPLAAQEPPAASAPAPQMASGGPYTVEEPLIDSSDLSCNGFITQEKHDGDLYIAGQEETGKVGLTLGDLVFLSQGRDTLTAGSEFSVVQRSSRIKHPASGRKLGWYYERLGRVKVMAVYEKSAIAEITFACDEIRAGHELVPHELAPFPIVSIPPFRPHDVSANGNEIGYLVHTRDENKVVATGDIVYVDLGHEDGLKPGDFLTAFEPAGPASYYGRGIIKYDYEWGTARFQTPNVKRGDPENFPPRILGQLIVMSTENHTASAKIIYSVAELSIGTMVEPR